MMRRPTLLLCMLLVGSCTTGRSFPTFHDYRAEHTFALANGRTGPEVRALATRFYADTLDPAAAAREVDALLPRYPSSGLLHEMAAHLAELREDDESAWAHWLRAAADRSSPFTEIYLDRAFAHDLTTRQESASIALLEAMVEAHPRQSVRADAARRLVTFYEARERYAQADHSMDGFGFIRDWKLIGGFDNDQGRGFHAVHPPEQRIDLRAEVRGLLTPVRWRDVAELDRSGMVQIGDRVSPDRWAVAYLLTHVSVGAPTDAQLRVTTGDGVRVWLNGEIVVDQERVARSATDNIVVPVHLARGYNRILVKSAHDDSGAWTFGARLTDRAGRALRNLRYDRALHAHPRVAPHTTPNVSPLAHALESLTPELRKALLTHHDAVRSGFQGDALAHARTLLETAPEHPVVIYHAALTHWNNDELGRVMDLLNQGVNRFPRQAGFLWLRGAFYRERDRYDRAIEDLRRAIRLAPRARIAQMELAATFEDRTFYEQQCQTLEHTVDRWPDSGWALRALGYCEQMRGYNDRAQALYERADAVQPGHEWNLERLAAVARSRQDYPAAIRYADRLRAYAPWSVEHLLHAGDQLRFAGRRNEATALYRQAVARDPAWSPPHDRLAIMAYEDGHPTRALAEWSAALTRDPDNSVLADRVDFMRESGRNDPDRRLMPTDEQIERAVASAAQLEVDPGAHTVLVLDDEVTTVQQDGSAMRRITQVHLAVTTDGRDDLIRSSVPPNARILQAFAVSPDGTRQEASSMRGGVVRFRGLDVRSRVVLQYVHHDPPPSFLPNHFVSSWLFQGIHRQEVQGRWMLQVPAGRRLAIHIRGPIRHTVRRDGALDVHVFTASNVPPLVPEPSMPPPGDLLAMVTLSTLTEWGEYVEWERALLSEVFESNAQLRGLATRLTQGAATPRERLDRIYHYASQEIRYQQDYENSIAGVRPHSCPVVLERGYGDCKDKAVLMILLAREVGLNLRFAILRTSNAGRVVREVPNQQFNHAIVYVPRQEGIAEGFFMDPTTDGLDMGNLRSDDQGALALVLNPTDGRWEFVDIPFQSADRQTVSCSLDVRVASTEQATARSQCTIRGNAASAIRRVVRNEERARQLYQNMANSMFSGATVSEAGNAHANDIWHPVELTMSLDASSALQPQGSDHRMPVPSAFPLGPQTRLERRRTPLDLGPPESQRWEVSYEVPAGARILRTPENFDIRHACFSVSRRTVTRGRRATISMRYERTCTEVSPESYGELRRLAQRAANQLSSEIIFDL